MPQLNRRAFLATAAAAASVRALPPVAATLKTRPAKRVLELVYDKSYPLGTPDLSPVMKGAKASNPDAFIAWSYPPDSFGLAEQAIIEDLDVSIYYSAVATSFPAFFGAYGSKIDNVLGAGVVDVANIGAVDALVGTNVIFWVVE